MLICTGELEVKCEDCGTIHTVDGAGLVFEVVETHEREMDIERNWQATHDIDCDGGGGVDCDKQIRVDYNVWEYPSGQIETHEPTIDGGSATGRFNVSIEQTAD
ncbi:MAG TPA: hypothetical protein VG603_07755 [Chitinophagales bacterium]|nr:hypothetical protein [Chitinophagales bacterium]